MLSAVKKTFLLATVVLAGIRAYCQQKPATINLDFEQTERGMPAGWKFFGSPDYLLGTDSGNAKSGRFAATIVSEKGGNFKAWALTLPANYPGKKITLTGFIKTENVTKGAFGPPNLS